MSEFISNFHFLRPWWLLALVLPLFGYYRFAASLKTNSAWEGVCDKNLLNFLLVKGSSKQRSLISGVCLLGLIGAIFALSGPTWQKKEIPAYVPENPLMILLNLSSDMEAKDITPDRLSRAKYNIADLLKMLSNTQSGLIVYTNEPYLISPISEDTRLLGNLLSAINIDIMPENGDKLNRAIDLAVEKMQGSGYHKGNIVVFAADSGQDFNAALKSAEYAKVKGFDISVICVSSKNNEKLEKIADKGGGIYAKISGTGQALEKLNSFIKQTQSDALKTGSNSQEVWLDFGYYLVIIPLLCCLYLFRRGVVAAAIVLCLSSNAYAGFFLNNNQEGIKAFENQNFAKAASSFEQKDWKASSYYRLGDYEKAYQNFAIGNDVESLYNQGNALAKGGKTEEAIAKYEEVLKQNPDHEDAKFNLDYLKQQQEQQQNQNNQDNKEQDKQDNKEQNSSSEQNQQNQEQDNKEEQQQQQEQQKQQEQEQQRSNEQKSDDQEQEDKKPEQQQQEQKQEQQAQPDKKQDEKKNAQQAQAEPKKDKPEYDEEIQAREQQYRDIPEDTGGLLRAFIKREYIKNRYKDN